MSSSVVTAVGVFVGGVAVGATGALLLGPREALLPPPPPRAVVPASPPSSSASTLPAASLYADERLIGGYPGPVSDFLRHVAYVSSYDRMHRHPHWTAEHITASSLASRKPDGEGGQRVDRSRSVFQEDPRLPPLFRARNADYFRSGYDRGHMVPAADAKQSQTAMDETFYLSNMAPQVGEGFNRDYWAHTEDFVRRLTQHFADVYVFTVPLYLPRQTASDGKWRVTYEVIGDPPNVSVPTHFAKVVYAHGRPGATATTTAAAPLALPGVEGSGGGGSGNDGSGGGFLGRVGLRAGEWSAIGAFVMPNAIIPNDVPLRSFAVPIESVERAAGLLLFPPAVKTNTRALCDAIDCSLIVRDFSNRNKGNSNNNNSKQTRGGAA